VAAASHHAIDGLSARRATASQRTAAQDRRNETRMLRLMRSKRVKSETESDIDPAHGAALGALEMGGNIVPVPIREIGDLEAPAVMEAVALHFQAVDPNRAESFVPLHRTGPISKD
jgi:hypothetical protein